MSNKDRDEPNDDVGPREARSGSEIGNKNTFSKQTDS
jgi:hypothetical protein